ncbi:hypothetical protein ES705_26352 [subsurface metagenome]|nr:transcription factor [Methanosarcinales archaeon]
MIAKESQVLEGGSFLVNEYFRKMIGEEGMKIMENVPAGEITDEEIARLSDTKLSSVRKVLYTLYENRIAEYRTERDDNSGWITYLWRFNRDNVKKIMEEEAEVNLNELNRQLEEERKGVFYQCNCQRILFEEAAAKNFCCDECGSNFEYIDNGSLIKELEEQVEVIAKWMKGIEEG